MHQFNGRRTQQFKLSFLTRAWAAWVKQNDLMEGRPCRSSHLFKRFANGKFGEELVCLYLEKMRLFPKLGLPQLAKDCFVISLAVMGELWRRFTFDKQCCPFQIFSLLDTSSDEEFLQLYQKFQQTLDTCPQCVDHEFSTVILRHIPLGARHRDEEVRSKIEAIRSLLCDLTTFTPISSDLVECLHGFQQAKLHRFRGRKPTDHAAQEITMLASIQSTYKQFWQFAWSRLGDKFATRRFPGFDRKGCNQYTHKEKYLEERQRHKGKSIWKMENMDRIVQRPEVVKKPRQLSGNSVVCLAVNRHPFSHVCRTKN